MARPISSKYDAYAKHRIVHRLLELYQTQGNWDALARAITEFRKSDFARTDLNRVRNGTAGDVILDNVVSWIEHADPGFRQKLKPESIFAEVGISARDYYFQLFTMANLDEWDENLLRQFEGVYLCAPEDDLNSYLPSPHVRRWLEKSSAEKSGWPRRSVDIRGYIHNRSFITLTRTSGHYFHAAEIPMGALLPASWQSLDPLSFYEGIGIASSNSIHVFLRECLSRVPKIHSMVIRPKQGHNITQFKDMRIYHDNIKGMVSEWGLLEKDYIDHMQREFDLVINAEYFIRGTSQISLSPLPMMNNIVSTVFGTEQVYHRKPLNFLRDLNTHFILPEMNIQMEIERLISNPLAVRDFA